MTIATTTNRVDASGNGSATSFSFSPVVIFEASDLQVTVRDSSGAETAITAGAGSANYSVSVASYPGTGAITYPASGGTPLPVGSTIVIKRIVPLLQSVSLSNQGAYFPKIQEGEYDYLTAIDQQQQEQLNRTVQLAETDPSTPVLLPTTTARAGQYLAFDSSGAPIAAAPAGGSGAPISAAMQPVVVAATKSAAAALLGVSTVMQPVVASATLLAALELLGVSPAMAPVVAAASVALALQALTTTGSGIFGASTDMGLGVAVSGMKNGIIGQVTNSLAPATVAFPTGVTGYGSITTAGNTAFGVFGRSDLSTVNVPGIAIGAEFNSFNFAHAPSGVQPANMNFGTTDYVCNAVQAVAYGNFPSSIGYAVLLGSQVFQYGIYVASDSVGSYGLLIDGTATNGRAGAGAVIRERASTGVPALILQSKGVYNPTGSVFQIVDDGGAGHFTVNQAGDIANSGMTIEGTGTINFITTGTAASASAGVNGALPAQVAGYMIHKINGSQVKIPYYAV